MKFSLLFLFLAALLLVSSISCDANSAASAEAVENAPATEAAATPTPSSSDVFSSSERAAMHEEKHEFQAEVTRLMDIIINSLYSKREIFIRELISNAADALDKIRYLALTNQTTLGEGDQAKLEVKISFDKDGKTLTIRDTGVGMTKTELMKNLGVVAASGTSQFVEAATNGAGSSDALSLIGQFGVGFYSVYLAADKVTVISKSNNDNQYVWESTADRTFTIAEDPRGNTLGRGTQITLHMKDDATEFLNQDEIKKLVEKYSEFINYPIYLLTSKQVDKEVPDAEAEEKAEKEKAAKKEGEDLDVSEESEAEEEKKPKMKTIKETVWEWIRLNDVKAIWTRTASDISDEEYTAFYRTLTKDTEAEPLEHIHFKAEGEITFRSILYIPKKAPAALYDKFYEKSTALKLYVRRVMISDEFDDFLPRYLNFIKGVVDSEDLPLNVSRETLAQSRVLKVMAKKLTRKVLEMLKRLADGEKEDKEDKEKEAEEAAESSEEDKDKKASKDAYQTFWKEFGKSIKLGVIDDRANRAKLAKLLRFQTSKSEGKFISLEDYVDRMKPKQKYIYYITGESSDAVKNSPFLEKLNARGLEVVYMVDPLDEYLVQSMSEFEGTQLTSVTKEGLKLDSDDKDRLAKYKEDFKDLCSWLQGIYGAKVEKVVVSNRIAKSPMVVVTGQYGWSANMERIMGAQTFAKADEATWLHSKKTLEINPFHPIIKELKSKVAANGEDKSLPDLAQLLYDAALLQSGFSMKEPNDFATRIHRVVSSGLDVDPNAEPDQEPEEEETTEETAESTGGSASEESSDSAEHEEL
jgi:heat shock protein beta